MITRAATAIKRKFLLDKKGGHRGAPYESDTRIVCRVGPAWPPLGLLFLPDSSEECQGSAPDEHECAANDTGLIRYLTDTGFGDDDC